MTYVISDLHGYPLEKFKMLLDKAGFCDDDELFILGDVVDRNGDGDEAMNAYPDLVNHTPEEQADIRKNLLAYCLLDTLAMVKVPEKLYDMC